MAGKIELKFSITSLLLYLTVAGVSFTACVEPFLPEPKDSPTLLVVEGLVSDRSEPYSIRLSHTQPLNSSGSAPATGAHVYLADSESVFEFQETEAGIYQSDPSCLVGQPGRIYTLKIEIGDGNIYQSEPVLLKGNVPIDSVYFERQKRFTDIAGEELDGVKILVDTHDPEGKIRYYRYEWKETYEIKVPYPSNLSVWVCYNTLTSSDIITANTSQLKEARVSQLEVKYVGTDGYRLRSLYRLLVKQFALSLDEIKYWTELKKISENQGTLFDPLPYDLHGNLFNPDNRDEQVLGFFGVGGVVEKEIYIARNQLLDLDFVSNGCSSKIVEVSGGSSPPFGSCLAYQGTYGTGINYYAPSYCCDCQLYGSLEVPDFWPK